MGAFAAHEFKLARKGSDGHSLREHLQSVQQQTGQSPPELQGPELYPACAHWFTWWYELAEGRQSGLGTSPLAWADIAAWSTLTGRQLDPYDIEALRTIDRAYLDANKPPATTQAKGRQ